MKVLVKAAVIVAAAGLLFLSIVSALREQERRLGAFTARFVQQVHASVEALSARLEVLDQDARMLSDLVERSQTNEYADPIIERRLWSSAFQSMAIVVTQYRAIAYIREDDTLEVLAVDPGESLHTIDALMVPARRLVAALAQRRVKALGHPTVYPAAPPAAASGATTGRAQRSFLLYGTRVPSGGTVVVITDSQAFLGNVGWTSLPDARLFVTDPAQTVWSDCETSGGCRAPESPAVAGLIKRRLRPTPASSISPVDAAASKLMGLGGHPALQVSERVVRPAGTWTVTWLASTEELAEARRALLFRIIATAAVVAAAVAAVGVTVLRQQRQAVALQGRLQYAQALAAAREASEAELRSLQNQLIRAEKVITVGVLSAGIAHEIGSPLAVIRGRAEQVLREVATGSRADDLKTIIKHIDAISSTIRQLLDFSRRQPIERQAVTLDSAVERTKGLLQWKLEARKLHLRVTLAEGLPPLAADPDQLVQVLVNLLLNACDASDADSDVALDAAPMPGDRVRLEIIDQGCGIAPEHMNAVFDPFFTTKRRGEGTGLGLSIVAGIVRNHGGEIHVTSSPGNGTKVTVTWPVMNDGEARYG